MDLSVSSSSGGRGEQSPSPFLFMAFCAFGHVPEMYSRSLARVMAT